MKRKVSRAAAPVCGFSRGTTARSVSLSWGAREVGGWKDPLEKGMATHSSILAWRIPWTEDPGRLQSMGL